MIFITGWYLLVSNLAASCYSLWLKKHKHTILVAIAAIDHGALWTVLIPWWEWIRMPSNCLNVTLTIWLLIKDIWKGRESANFQSRIKLLWVNYHFDVTKHWCLRKFNHFSFLSYVSQKARREPAEEQMKKQSLLQKMVRYPCPATSLCMPYYEYLQNWFHSWTEPRTATQCFSLFIKSCFISSISLIFHSDLQHGMLDTSLVWMAGQ